MFVVIDFNTGVELGPASHEMQLKWFKRKDNALFIEHIICCVTHRVIIKEIKR